MVRRLSPDSLSRAVIRALWSRPVACSRRSRCKFLFQRLLAVAQAFQRRRHVVLAEGDLAQAVSSTLIALSGNWRPEM